MSHSERRRGWMRLLTSRRCRHNKTSRLPARPTRTCVGQVLVHATRKVSIILAISWKPFHLDCQQQMATRRSQSSRFHARVSNETFFTGKKILSDLTVLNSPCFTPLIESIVHGPAQLHHCPRSGCQRYFARSDAQHEEAVPHALDSVHRGASSTSSFSLSLDW